MLTTHGVFQMRRLEAGGGFHETSLCPWPPVSRAEGGHLCDGDGMGGVSRHPWAAPGNSFPCTHSLRSQHWEHSSSFLASFYTLQLKRERTKAILKLFSGLIKRKWATDQSTGNGFGCTDFLKASSGRHILVLGTWGVSVSCPPSDAA